MWQLLLNADGLKVELEEEEEILEEVNG